MIRTISIIMLLVSLVVLFSACNSYAATNEYGLGYTDERPPPHEVIQEQIDELQTMDDVLPESTDELQTTDNVLPESTDELQILDDALPEPTDELPAPNEFTGEIGIYYPDYNNNAGEAILEEAPEKSVITVSSPEELLAALGSNRRILLQEGEYNLTSASQSHIATQSVFYCEKFDGPELTLNGIHNLTIQGAGDKLSEIVVDPRYVFVIKFTNCSGISIENVKAGHSEGGYCMGGVFCFEDSSIIGIDGSLMYGCGTIGLDLLRVKDMEVADSIIYECTTGIMTIDQCSDIAFKGCTFKDNKDFQLVEIWDTTDFIIDSCTFLHNTGSTMFITAWSENMVVKNTLFRENSAASFTSCWDRLTGDAIVFELSNTFENNNLDYIYRRD